MRFYCCSWTSNERRDLIIISACRVEPHRHLRRAIVESNNSFRIFWSERVRRSSRCFPVKIRRCLLLVRRNALLVPNLCLHVLNCGSWVQIQGDGLSSRCVQKDLYSTTKTKDQMLSRFLLEIVIRKAALILVLLTRKDQTLLVSRNAIHVKFLLVTILFLTLAWSYSFLCLRGVCWIKHGLLIILD